MVAGRRLRIILTLAFIFAFFVLWRSITGIRLKLSCPQERVVSDSSTDSILGKMRWIDRVYSGVHPIFLQWMPDSSTLAFACQDEAGHCQVFMCGPETMKGPFPLRALTKGAGQAFQFLSLDPTGNRLAYERGNSSIMNTLHISTLNEERTIVRTESTHCLPRRWGSGPCMPWSCDGQWLAFFKWHEPRKIAGKAPELMAALSIRSANSPKESELLVVAEPVKGVAWSTDGQWITYQGRSRGERMVARVRPGGGPEERLSLGDYDGSICVSPDAEELVLFRHNRLLKIDYTSRKETVLAHAKEPYRNLQWSPEGEWISYEKKGTDTSAGVIAKRGRQGGMEYLLTPVKGEMERWGHVWSPNGKRIAYLRSSPRWGVQLCMVDTDITEREAQYRASELRRDTLHRKARNRVSYHWKRMRSIVRTIVKEIGWTAKDILLRRHD